MASKLPPELHDVLEATSEDDRERAWGTFVRAYSRLVLHTSRSQANGYDDTMDRYTFVLEQLQRDDFKRLRRFHCDGRTRFTTWLVVVVRRLCVDFDRMRYGRRNPSSQDLGRGGNGARDLRRSLVDLVSVPTEVTELVDSATPSPDLQVRTQEIQRALQRAIDGLSPRERLLLTLRFDDQASVRDITHAMDFPTQFHVYRKLKQLMSTLRRQLEEHGIGDPRP